MEKSGRPIRCFRPHCQSGLSVSISGNGVSSIGRGVVSSTGGTKHNRTFPPRCVTIASPWSSQFVRTYSPGKTCGGILVDTLEVGSRTVFFLGRESQDKISKIS